MPTEQPRSRTDTQDAPDTASGAFRCPETTIPYDEALELLDRVARGLAMTFGPSCEALVQDLTDEGLVVRSIYNGHVSGRSVGSTLSIYGGGTAPGDVENAELDLGIDSVGLLATTPDGRRVKSSTWTLCGPGYLLELGVNMDITAVGQAIALLDGMQQTEGELRDQMRRRPTLPQEPQAAFDAQLARFGKPAELLTRPERVRLVRALRDAGFFEFQKSVPLVAEQLGVSKCTVYNYLRATEQE